MTIYDYLNNVLQLYSQSSPGMEGLSGLDNRVTFTPEYKSLNVQRLYTLRHVYANAFEYKKMYETLFKRLPYKESIHVVSLGCGVMPDYLALIEALGEIGAPKCKVRYLGVDRIDWHDKMQFKKGHKAKFICNSAAEVLGKGNRLSADVYFFPKSIREMDPVTFSCICKIFSERELEKDVFHVLISRYGGNTSARSDAERVKSLTTAIESNMFKLDDSFPTHSVYDLKGRSVNYCSPSFVYPEICDELREIISPILAPSRLRYQVLTFRKDR